MSSSHASLSRSLHLLRPLTRPQTRTSSLCSLFPSLQPSRGPARSPDASASAARRLLVGRGWLAWAVIELMMHRLPIRTVQGLVGPTAKRSAANRRRQGCLPWERQGVSGAQRYRMPAAHCKLQGRAPLVNVQASPWDPTQPYHARNIEFKGTARHEHALPPQRLRHPNPSRAGDCSASDTDPGSNHLTSRPIHLLFWGSIRPCIPWLGPWVGPWAGGAHDVTREASRFPGGVGLLVGLRGRQAPFRAESEAYGYGTAHDVLYRHRNRLRRSPLTRERLPRPAHRVAIMFLFWTALLMHAAQKRSRLPPTRAFGFGLPNQHAFALPAPPTLRLPPCAR